MEMLLVGVSLVFLGIGVGIMSAMFGVGGGVLMVPFLVFLLGATQHEAEGTSLFVIVPTALAGVFAHRKRGYVLVRPAFLIAVLGTVGAYAGARLALSIDAESLQRVFGVFVFVVGVRLLVQGRRLRSDASA
ncbi:MAG: sulfite exporter TauE/SafE family protein [Actinomycetota bacterium]